jgi:predicted DNA-binding protein
MKETVLHIRIDTELQERLKEAAKGDGRTLSGLIRKVLGDYINKPLRRQ